MAVANYYYSGQGKCYLADRDTSGQPMGFTYMGDVSSVKIQVKSDTIEHHESYTGQRGIDLRLTRSNTASVMVDMESLNSYNLAQALWGSTTSVGTTDLVVSNEIHNGYGGKTMALNNINIKTTPAPTLTIGATPTTVVAADYTFNYATGSVTFVAAPTTTGWTDGNPVTVGYTATKGQVRVDALTNARPEKWLRFEGVNTASNNDPVVVDVFRFSIDPLQELAVLSDDIAKATLEGTALADPYRTTGTGSSVFFREFLMA